MDTPALKRLMKEYQKFQQNPPKGIMARPISEQNMFEWEVFINGPEGTCYEGGVFPARLKFPPDYPLLPPKMKFTCEMYHPNIYIDGRVCISILRMRDIDGWSPALTIEKVLMSVVSLLAQPNDKSGANPEAAKMWRDNREKYNKIVKNLCRRMQS